MNVLEIILPGAFNYEVSLEHSDILTLSALNLFSAWFDHVLRPSAYDYINTFSLCSTWNTKNNLNNIDVRPHIL